MYYVVFHRKSWFNLVDNSINVLEFVFHFLMMTPTLVSRSRFDELGHVFERLTLTSDIWLELLPEINEKNGVELDFYRVPVKAFTPLFKLWVPIQNTFFRSFWVSPPSFFGRSLVISRNLFSIGKLTLLFNFDLLLLLNHERYFLSLAKLIFMIYNSFLISDVKLNSIKIE